MMNRDTWLEQEKARILKSLNRSAKKEGILLPGERLVFSIVIQVVPLVVEENGRKPSELIEFTTNSSRRGRAVHYSNLLTREDWQRILAVTWPDEARQNVIHALHDNGNHPLSPEAIGELIPESERSGIGGYEKNDFYAASRLANIASGYLQNQDLPYRLNTTKPYRGVKGVYALFRVTFSDKSCRFPQLSKP